MFNSLRSQRLLGLFALGWLLLNAPLLTLWDSPRRLFGLPAMPLALFIGWGLLIALAAWVAEAPHAASRRVGAEPGVPAPADQRD